MFGKLSKALNDTAKAAQSGIDQAVTGIKNASQQMYEQAKVEDKQYFDSIAMVPLSPYPMDMNAFTLLVQAYEKAGVPNEKARVLKEAARQGNGFACQQIVQLVKQDTVPVVSVGAATWCKSFVLNHSQNSQNFIKRKVILVASILRIGTWLLLRWMFRHRKTGWRSELLSHRNRIPSWAWRQQLLPFRCLAFRSR